MSHTSQDSSKDRAESWRYVWWSASGYLIAILWRVMKFVVLYQKAVGHVPYAAERKAPIRGTSSLDGLANNAMDLMCIAK